MDSVDLMDLAKLIVTLIDVECMRGENEANASDKATQYGKTAFQARRHYSEQVIEHIIYREDRAEPRGADRQ